MLYANSASGRLSRRSPSSSDTEPLLFAERQEVERIRSTMSAARPDQSGDRKATMSSRGQQLREPRHVFANDQVRNAMFPPNKVVNWRYTWWNFIPFTLFNQLKWHFNRYFLIIAILQLFPQITPVSPITTWVPLALIFGLSSILELLSDRKKRLADKAFNEKPVTFIRDGVESDMKSEDLRVGDIVILRQDAEVPCDLVCLATSEVKEGGCFIQTTNLDGETDFKPRNAVECTHALGIDAMRNFQGVLECPAPSSHLYVFDSVLHEDVGDFGRDSRKSDRLHPISIDNFLPQGCTLRNTERVAGIAVYTANQTKLGMNKKKGNLKSSKVSMLVNRLALAIFFIQLIVCAMPFGIAGVALFETYISRDGWYINWMNGQPISMTTAIEDQPGYQFLNYFFIPLRFLLLCSYMIPISLKVTLDFARFINFFLINSDLQMYDDEKDKPAESINMATTEDLGMVTDIVTDKTGTLTRNEMVFKKACIRGNVYGQGRASADIFNDDSLSSAIKKGDEDVLMYFRCLALCNAVVVDNEEGKRVLKASSPDELALLDAAEHFGVVLVGRNKSEVCISLQQRDGTKQEEKYRILNTLEFTSQRRRMSVVLRQEGGKEDGRVLVITKGADDLILQMCLGGRAGGRGSFALGHGERLEGEPLVAQTTARAGDDFASAGLRILGVAWKTMTEEAYARWADTLKEAQSVLIDREERVQEAYMSVEGGLILQGLTAIEDRLQDKVPETIDFLRRARVRFWMVTGDKPQTAEQVAYAARLIPPNDGESTILRITGKMEDEVEDSLDGVKEGAKAVSQYAVLVEGSVLQIVLADAEMRRKFFDVSIQAIAVICSRVAPVQKAEIVNMLKENNCLPLAIGDGGNDVSMILESNVGVGIAGKEGMQAARAADFVLGRFSFLKRLMVVHGRYSVHRMQFIALYSFYKSIYVCFIQLLFAFFSAFSGASFLSSFGLTMYNTLFTGIPPFVYMLDKDVPEDMLRTHPGLYERNVKSPHLNLRTFVRWFVLSLIHASIVFFFSIFGFFLPFPGGFAMTQEDALLLATCTSLVIQAGVFGLDVFHLTWVTGLVLFGNFILSFFIVLLAYYNLAPALGFSVDAPYFLYTSLLGNPNFWLNLILTSTTVLLSAFGLKAIREVLFPSVEAHARVVHSDNRGRGIGIRGSKAYNKGIMLDETDSSSHVHHTVGSSSPGTPRLSEGGRQLSSRWKLSESGQGGIVTRLSYSSSPPSGHAEGRTGRDKLEAEGKDLQQVI